MSERSEIKRARAELWGMLQEIQKQLRIDYGHNQVALWRYERQKRLAAADRLEGLSESDIAKANIS